MHRLRTLGAALGAAAALLGPRVDLAQVAAFTEQRCRLSTPSLPAAFARCATLTVPEDPATPGAASVELFVARIAALNATPRPDPLVIISGGPGQSAVDFYLEARGAFEQVRRDRDLILLDQRGTGRSAVGFGCSLPDDLPLEVAGADAVGRVVDVCLAALDHNPRFYTTSVAVQDLERLRATLGVEHWNLYGVSYGTRVVQHYLRRFPQRVRAIVIDGVVPPDLALGPDVAREAQRALDRIFERCAADAGCAARFADLPGEFTELLARLEAEPLAPASNGEVPFGASHARALVRFLSYNGATAALVPVLLHEAHAGNYTPLVSQASTTLRGLPESLSMPMSNSVLCTEDVPFMAANAADGLGETYLGTTIVDAARTVCARWPAGAIDADFKALVVSDRPALLLSGSNDPITPPAYADRVIAGGLTNSKHLIGRDQGHGLALVGCMPRVLRAFLETPVPQELDADCLTAEPPAPFFLSLLGPGP